MEKPRSRGVIRVTNTHTLSLSLCVCVWIHPKNWGDKNSEVCSAMTQLNIGNKGCENLRVNKNLCQWFFSGLSSLSLSLSLYLSLSLSLYLSLSLIENFVFFGSEFLGPICAVIWMNCTEVRTMPSLLANSEYQQRWKGKRSWSRIRSEKTSFNLWWLCI